MTFPLPWSEEEGNFLSSLQWNPDGDPMGVKIYGSVLASPWTFPLDPQEFVILKVVHTQPQKFIDSIPLAFLPVAGSNLFLPLISWSQLQFSIFTYMLSFVGDGFAQWPQFCGQVVDFLFFSAFFL